MFSGGLAIVDNRRIVMKVNLGNWADCNKGIFLFQLEKILG